MSLIVQKFGGSSVSDVAAMQRVAKRIVETKKAGHDVVVVVSAMGDTTDELLDMAAALNPSPHAREMDLLMSAGERISMSLLAMAIEAQGVGAHAFTGRQAGVHTDSAFGKASILGVVPERVVRCIQAGNVAIVAGFQGLSERDDVTTLGRGGSDTTAVALAAALRADVCEIYTDVDGLFTADPRVVPSARRITTLTAEETLELAAHGAKILHLRAVEYARRHHVALHVRSSFSDKDGTWIADHAVNPDLVRLLAPSLADTIIAASKEDPVEAPLITGIAHDRSQSKITLTKVPDRPGLAARIFAIVAAAEANIDMIVQNVSVDDGHTDLSFTLPTPDGPGALAALQAAKEEIGYGRIFLTDEIGKLSLVGAGMRSHPGVSAKLFGALSEAGINIEMISTSEIRISVVTALADLDAAVRATHTAFGLDSASAEAIVYGGTGR
ncbi:aspartate kinase [Buchananella hordeovulneris]|uniref:Aspartokinase n=1 Tax=Buchananella hordeovulneris TaxID=52770 RepID=A0A1Q5PUB8_9ACTO|nr:aspartate kinase [Buchananella hordeovulneris]MDO5080569.1 aspartate kinase [Buchananella hordeovulneris]OKL51178.1 aspartate kinase [Buchananella hordeovulneris]RRD49321.1 aspartate kinase [Buchananella hordeovulneris]